MSAVRLQTTQVASKFVHSLLVPTQIVLQKMAAGCAARNAVVAAAVGQVSLKLQKTNGAETSCGMYTNGVGVGLMIYSQWLLLPVAWLVCAAVPSEICWLMAVFAEMVSYCRDLRCRWLELPNPEGDLYLCMSTRPACEAYRK